MGADTTGGSGVAEATMAGARTAHSCASTTTLLGPNRHRGLFAGRTQDPSLNFLLVFHELALSVKRSADSVVPAPPSGTVTLIDSCLSFVDAAAQAIRIANQQFYDAFVAQDIDRMREVSRIASLLDMGCLDSESTYWPPGAADRSAGKCCG